MHMDYVIFLILSNIAYTKFSEGPSIIDVLNSPRRAHHTKMISVVNVIFGSSSFCL